MVHSIMLWDILVLELNATIRIPFEVEQLLYLTPAPRCSSTLWYCGLLHSATLWYILILG